MQILYESKERKEVFVFRLCILRQGLEGVLGRYHETVIIWMGDFNDDELLLLVKSEEDLEGIKNDDPLVPFCYLPMGRHGWTPADE